MLKMRSRIVKCDFFRRANKSGPIVKTAAAACDKKPRNRDKKCVLNRENALARRRVTIVDTVVVAVVVVVIVVAVDNFEAD